MSIRDHLFVGEKMKNEDAGGIGSFCEADFISDIRRGFAPTASDSAFSTSVILHTTRVTLRLVPT